MKNFEPKENCCVSIDNTLKDSDFDDYGQLMSIVQDDPCYSYIVYYQVSNELSKSSKVLDV